MDAKLICERTPYVDPLQQRWIALRDQQRQVVAELREVTRQMRIGKCDVCGKEFTRLRPTKRYCSMRCTQRAAPSNKGTIDIPLIREHWTLLEASGLLNSESMRVLSAIVYDNAQFDKAAGMIGVSRQRGHQIAIRATQQMRIVLAVRNAVIAGMSAEGR